MVEVVEPVTTIRLDTPAGLVVAEVPVRGRRREGGDAANVPSFRARAGRRPSKVAGLRRGHATTWPSAATSTRSCRSTRSGCPSTAARKQDILDAGLAIMAAINEQRRAGAPRQPRDRRLPPRPARRARLRRPALPARDGDPPRLVRPLAVRHGHQRPDGPAARPRRAAARRTTSSTSPSSARSSSGGPSGDDRRSPATSPPSSPRSPAAPGSPAPPSTSSTPPTRSPRASSCDAAPAGRAATRRPSATACGRRSRTPSGRPWSPARCAGDGVLRAAARRAVRGVRDAGPGGPARARPGRAARRGAEPWLPGRRPDGRRARRDQRGPPAARTGRRRTRRTAAGRAARPSGASARPRARVDEAARPGTSSRTSGPTGTSTWPSWSCRQPRPRRDRAAAAGPVAALRARGGPAAGTLRQAAAEHERLSTWSWPATPKARGPRWRGHVGHVRAEWSPAHPSTPLTPLTPRTGVEPRVRARRRRDPRRRDPTPTPPRRSPRSRGCTAGAGNSSASVRSTSAPRGGEHGQELLPARFRRRLVLLPGRLLGQSLTDPLGVGEQERMAEGTRP